MRLVQNYRELKLLMKAMRTYPISGDSESDFMALSAVQARLMALEDRVPVVYRDQDEYADNILFAYTSDELKSLITASLQQRQQVKVICLNVHRMNAWVEEMRQGAEQIYNRGTKKITFRNGLTLHFINQGLVLQLQGDQLTLNSRVIVEAY